MPAGWKDRPYEYKEIGEDEIRLLILDPQSEDGPDSELSGELKTFTLTMNLFETNEKHENEACRYEALSYTWGDSQPETGALRTFRAESGPEPLYLWIDAICIHPDVHNHEKGAQIQKMAEIYAEAEKVRVWLGSDDKDESQHAFDFIEEVLLLKRFDELCDLPANAKRWEGFLRLMQKPWFQRRWVVQEIAFAREAVIYWGSRQLPWIDLASAVQLFALKKDSLRQMFHKSQAHHNDVDFFGEIEAYGALGLVNIMDIMFRKSETGDIMDLLLSLESILTNMTAFDATRPHDTVYAVMQLSNDAKPVSMTTLVREQQRAQKEGNHIDLWVPAMAVVDTNRGPTITHSPESFNGTRRGVEELPISLTSENEWADELQWRGRPRQRSPHSGNHLAVLSNNRARARSRDPSPAVAKHTAEKTHQKPKRRFHVDYEKSMFGLCSEVIDFVVAQSHSIDIICKPWVPNVLDAKYQEKEIHSDDRVALPSWIQSREKRPFGLNSDLVNRKYTRIAADPLVGRQLQGYKSYSASGRVPYPQQMKLIDDRILTAPGFVLDTVDKIGAPAINATIPANWLQLGAWGDKHRRRVKAPPPPEQFWRTLVANRASSDGPAGPPLYWREACQSAFSPGTQEGSSNLDTAELIRDLSGRIASPVVAFAERMRVVTWNRVLILTRGPEADTPGILGLAPQEAKEGDLVCILYGCSVPVLLRKKKTNPRTRSSSTARSRKRRRNQHDEYSKSRRNTTAPSPPNEGPQQQARRSRTEVIGNGAVAAKDSASVANGSDGDEYHFIGECYIHGMMDGEAFAKKEKHKTEETNFRLGCAVDCDCSRCRPTI